MRLHNLDLTKIWLNDKIANQGENAMTEKKTTEKAVTEKPMTEIEKLKLEGFNLFMARENFQQNIAAVSQRLQEISNLIHQLTKEQGDGDPKEA